MIKKAPNYNNFYLNDKSYNDYLKDGFTFKNITQSEIEECLLSSDSFLDKAETLYLKIKEGDVKLRFGPELHYGTLPFRNTSIREKASLVNDVDKKFYKHFFGEGLIRVIFDFKMNNENLSLGYISFCIHKEDAFLGTIQTWLPGNILNKISKKYFSWLPILDVMFIAFMQYMDKQGITKVFCSTKNNRKGINYRNLVDVESIGTIEKEDGNYWKSGTDYDEFFGKRFPGVKQNERWMFKLKEL
jgi:hypothetical protein|tara:strand:+ start:1596 stop:2327 length:732 start_codon:yes stop_codon:yes gene_type:complete